MGAIYKTIGYPVPTDINLDEEVMQNVLNHTPSFFWSYMDTSSSNQSGYHVEVGTDVDWSVAEMWSSGEVMSSDTSTTYAGLLLEDGQLYFLRIRVYDGTVWGTWKVASFTMNSVYPPILVSPSDSTVVQSSIPTLRIVYSDSEGDYLDYTVQVAVDTTFFFPLELYSSGTSGDYVDIIVQPSLEENKQYWWRAKVDDSFEESDYSEYKTFFVNEFNESPGPFSLAEPGSIVGDTINNQQPQFIWTSPVDPDPFDTLSYAIYIAIDSNFVFADSLQGISDTTHTLGYDLQWDRDYWWKVRAIDLFSDTEWSTEVFQFYTHEWVCIDSDDDGYGDPGHPENDCEDDNCPAFYNPNQENSDSDTVGDSCDNCILVTNPLQEDTDGDAIGDSCDNCLAHINPEQEDTDSDAVGDSCDNCLTIVNAEQEDDDSDAVGDSCDNCIFTTNPIQEDDDSDTVGDSCDNYIYTWNPAQADADSNGVGDACDWLCGDCDVSGDVDIDDVVYLINYIFAGGPQPEPIESGDADCSDGVDIDDVVYLIEYIFAGGPEPCAGC
jgi:hypothetical protein